MKPYIILHNSITLDGSLTGFMPDMELHYRLAGRYSADANLIGSETIIKGQEMFGAVIPDEEEGDFKVPQRDQGLPWWVVVDSGGKLMGMLHTCRRFEFCKDVIVLVSESTQEVYLRHLEERNYNYIKAGKVKVDLKSALSILAEKYGINKILTDTGQVLGSILINENMADEISLVIHPLLKGGDSYYIFGAVTSDIRLNLVTEERFENGCVWLTYRVG
jgi:2,5-diamino-6-(ribosylamino)-4(3H)-pyrimidinone 5'-phosphate reductase